jgi:hypothetical protein
MTPMIRSGTMLRWTTPFLTACLAAGSAIAADLPYPPGPGVYHKAPPVHGRTVHVEEDRDLLFTPTSDAIPYIPVPPLFHGPVLPGSSALPGYYGSPGSYDYTGPYYGGPEVSYWNRLPYACGFYGYC